jgi:hypothetical protein
MGRTLAALIVVSLATGLQAQESGDQKPARRYGVEPRVRDYPQATPKEALASVISAIEANRIDYLLAHLTDPKFVDDRVKQNYRGDFDRLVRETTTKLRDNPETVKEFRRYLKEGEWETSDKSAAARLKDVRDRQVFLRKLDQRWYLENRQKPELSKQER